MKIRFDINGQSFEGDSADAISIAIPMDFEGPQPSHFGAPRAVSATYKANGFVGDTNRGGSCNVNSLTMVPHCNGTHTESVGHIVNQDVYIGHSAADSLMTATLVTVEPELWKDVKQSDQPEDYRPPLDPQDWVITAAQLKSVFSELSRSTPIERTTALVIRTIGSIPKKSAAYGDALPPPFLTVQALELLISRGYRHLLVDFPSVDRMYDDGLLTNHHLYWGVVEGSHELGVDSRQDKTISEMVLVPDEVEDGLYLLNLQVPALCTDAAPSRPVIFRTRKI